MASDVKPHHRCRIFGSPWAGVHGTVTESARHYGRHWHATHGLGLIEHGAHGSASGRGQVEAQAGDLIATNPGEVHDGRPLGGPTRRWRMVYFDAGVIASMTGADGDVELASPVIRDPRLSRALLRLFARLERWNASQRVASIDSAALACEEALAETCGLLLARHACAEAAADPIGLKPARERLADELLNPPSLAELAAMVGCSRFQLLRRFEKAYGLPPHAWLLQQRAERARRLIRDGASLARAAAEAGFADQSHMTRMFSRQFGYTPGAWRNAAAC